MKRATFLLFTILFIQPLAAQSEIKSRVVALDLAESFSHQQVVVVSRFVDKISFIPLETKPEALVSGSANIEVTNEFIIVRQGGNGQKYQILLFERNSGKFVREIAKNGKGPGEYIIYSRIPFNQLNKELYALSPLREILVYDLAGKIINKIKMPEWNDPKIKDELPGSTRMVIENMLDNNIFVGYVPNISGWEKRKLVLFSSEGLLKVFPNYMSWDRGDFNGIILPPMGNFAHFYIWDNKLNFIEPYCDTLYQITKESMVPRYFFDLGKFHLPYSKQADLVKGRHVYDFFFITDIDENMNYIFIQLFYKKNMYTGFIDKRDNRITFCSLDTSDRSGLKDDISGMMDIIPNDFIGNNEMVYIIQPIKLMSWLKENPEKAALAKAKMKWLNIVDEFSNPIIAIGRCKD